jgi:DNA processing protein
LCAAVFVVKGKPMDLERPRFAPREEVFTTRRRRADAVRFTGLWVAGSLAGLDRITVAVVGSRAPSEAARRRATDLGRALARAGACVLSGLALGIDGAAHAGSLEGEGPTLGVLGGGHRHFFPSRNRALARAMIASGGAVLSPFGPDEPARPGQFLQRNGVVAALADAVVIVEAAERSGALNTAGWAADLGLDVFAYPGDVDRPKAAGCNALIRDGATLVRDPADILSSLKLALPVPAPPYGVAAPDDGPDGKSPLEASLDRVLARGPADLDALVDRLRAPPGDVLALLVRLEIAGLIERQGGRTYAQRRSERSRA